MKKLLFLLAFLLSIASGYAQVGINTTTPDAQLDIKSSNQATPTNTDGILIPKIDAFPVTNPTAAQNSMLVYLTTASGSNQPGFYYWDNATTSWKGFNQNADADWYQVGTPLPPNSITDDMYHLGNVGIGINIPAEKLHVSDNIKLGYNAWSNVADNRYVKFGDGNYVTIGEEISDDTMSLKAGSFMFNPSIGNGNVGIGILTAPTEKLEVAGKTKTTNFQMTNGAAIGRILTSDALGNATWTSTISNNWGLTGNAGTNSTINFIGTTDDNDVVFKRNNILSGKLAASNTSFGLYSLFSNTTGTFNCATGYQSMRLNTIGSSNTANGSDSLYSNTTGNFNTAIGNTTLYSNTTGSSNTATGFLSLGSNTIGSNNTANGNAALRSNTSGDNNVAVGTVSLFSNTVGSFNTANGNEALYTNTVGEYNTAIGNKSLRSNFTGSYNTATGNEALYSNTTGGYNTANGSFSLRSNTLGSYNSATGYYSLYSNTNGMHNTANGYYSLYSNSIGQYNTANGNYSLFSNTTGSNNLASGYRSLYTNSIGSYNVANGSYSIYSNTSGNYNSATGYQALYSNTTSHYNTANGCQALFFNRASYNTATGCQALYSNTSGISNTASGYNALYSNTTGSYNIANGLNSLYSNTTGSSNTANGVSSLYNNTNGADNTANGYQSLNSNSTGDMNTANGSSSLSSNTIGNNNTSSGHFSLYANLNGNNNTAIGKSSLSLNQSGNNNTAVGAYANSSSITFDNTTALGALTSITASNQIRLGNSTVTSIGGFANWTNVSDKRFKKDINQNVPGLEFIKKLKPVTYHLDINAIANYTKISDNLRIKESEILKENILQTGFIAQEVEASAKEVGFDFSGVDAPKNENDFYGLRYAEFVVPLVKAVQEQQQIIEQQNKKIQSLEGRLKVIEQKLSK